MFISMPDLSLELQTQIFSWYFHSICSIEKPNVRCQKLNSWFLHTHVPFCYLSQYSHHSSSGSCQNLMGLIASSTSLTPHNKPVSQSCLLCLQIITSHYFPCRNIIISNLYNFFHLYSCDSSSPPASNLSSHWWMHTYACTHNCSVLSMYGSH